MSCHGETEPLVVRALTARRRGLKLLTELDLTVAPGSILAVQGPSGAGKSTLLRMLAGLARPEGGAVEPPSGRLGMVFQDPRLLPWRSALENVALPLEGTSAERHRRAMDWLGRVRLADAANLRPAQLSGGMRQRVSIARALVVEPTLVLVDEPFSALDKALSHELRYEFSGLLRSRNCITVWVTHDPEEAAAVSDRVLEMAGPPNGEWRLHSSTDPLNR